MKKNISMSNLFKIVKSFATMRNDFYANQFHTAKLTINVSLTL